MAAASTPSIELRPSAPPPPGVIPDFIDPPSRSYQVYVAAGVCLPFMLIFAALRFYAKVFLLKSRSKADYACIVGLVAGIAYIGTTIAVVCGGTQGKHEWDFILKDWTEEHLRLSLVNEAIYGPLIWIVKLSLFFMLLELFGLLTWIQISVWLGIVVTGLFYFGYFTATMAICAPKGEQTQLAWLTILATPRCQENPAMILSIGIMNVLSDVYLLILPLPVILGLQLPKMKKLGVLAIFLTGTM